MLIPSIKYLLVLILFVAVNNFAQPERYTKDAENGYMWLAMDDPNLMYNSSKENYLSSILERLRITGKNTRRFHHLVAGTIWINFLVRVNQMNSRLKM
jgi:hypothetical protein